MRLASAALVTITSILVAPTAHGQEGARSTQTLPPLPASAPTPQSAPTPPAAPTPQSAPTPVPMVAVTPADARVDCATAVSDPRCQSVQLTEPSGMRKPKTNWYGWQTLITDGAALAMLIGAVAAKDDKIGNTLAPVAGLTYVFGGPIVHWAHRHGGMGAASLGLRLGAPVGLALLGYAIGTAADGGKRGLDSAALAGTVLGFLIGFPTAIALDAAVLAREDVEDEGPDAQAKLKLQRPWFQVHPDVQTSRTGAQVGLRGTF